MATKKRVNAREARREQALGDIVNGMAGAFGDYVRSQLAANAPQSQPSTPPPAPAMGARGPLPTGSGNFNGNNVVGSGQGNFNGNGPGFNPQMLSQGTFPPLPPEADIARLLANRANAAMPPPRPPDDDIIAPGAMIPTWSDQYRDASPRFGATGGVNTIPGPGSFVGQARPMLPPIMFEDASWLPRPVDPGFTQTYPSWLDWLFPTLSQRASLV